MTEEQQVFYHLGVALAIGMLIGVERGWKDRGIEEGERVAGVRTYGLTGLLGGGSALLAKDLGALVLGLGFLGLAGVLTAVYVVNLRRPEEDAGITSLVAGLVTFVLGALAGAGAVSVAAASAVVTTLLLGYKPTLHHWVGSLKAKELRAALKLLLISVVLLPVLPNRGYGPWELLNPYAIWWLVVLIAAISFVGYFAVKIGGAQKGIVFTGLFGGLASSTGLTLHLSRLARSGPTLQPVLAAGILLACGTMFPRMVLVATVLNPAIFDGALMPAVAMASLVYVPALWYWRAMSRTEADAGSPLKNPLELKTAVSFGIVLVLVMLLGKGLQEWFGDIGVLALSAASGVADVDAITVSLARMTATDLSVRVAVMGMVIAAAVNNLAKASMAAVIGGAAIGMRAGLPLVFSALAGPVVAWFWVW